MSVQMAYLRFVHQKAVGHIAGLEKVLQSSSITCPPVSGCGQGESSAKTGGLLYRKKDIRNQETNQIRKQLGWQVINLRLDLLYGCVRESLTWTTHGKES
jgi:hypothetical protein